MKEKKEPAIQKWRARKCGTKKAIMEWILKLAFNLLILLRRENPYFNGTLPGRSSKKMEYRGKKITDLYFFLF